MINVVIVEDNETIREGLAALINGTTGYSCVGSFNDCETFLDKLKSLSVDVVLMDIALPGMNGIEGVKKAIEIEPDLDILMLTIYEESEVVYDALCAGAVIGRIGVAGGLHLAIVLVCNAPGHGCRHGVDAV